MANMPLSMERAVDNTKFEELCRLCGTRASVMIAYNIFEGEGSIRQICKKIQTCLQIQVHHHDDLPKLICENCFYKLEMFWEFRARSYKTEELLVELCKQIKSAANSLNPNQDCVVDQASSIIMVPNQLLEDSLSNDIQIAHLTDRGAVLIHQEIILHHPDDVPHNSLVSLNLNSHDLGQDMSNQNLPSLQGTETILVSESERLTQDNFNLMQQQQFILNEQFRLHHELQVNLTGENAVNGYRLSEVKNNLNHVDSHNYHHSEKTESTHCISTINYSKSSLTVDNNLADENLGAEVNSHLNNIISYSSDSQLEHLRHDDNSESSNLLNDEEIHRAINKEGYLLSHEDGDSQDNSILQLNQAYVACTLCGKSFDNKSAFEVHYESHYYKCENCLLAFESLEILDTHKKTCGHLFTEEDQNSNESGKLAIIEEEGSVNISANNNIKEEVKVEQDLSNEADTEIIKDFDAFDYDALADCPPSPNEPPDESEQPKASDRKPGKHVCLECGKSYKTNYKLQEHMRKHTGETPFKCKSCEKTFRSKIGLAQHEAKHTGQYDFSCPTCGKGFQCKSYLMVHQRVHSNVKPYPCTTCEQSFKTKQALLDHTNRHLGVKPYKCEICGRGFITKGLCQAHLKIHAGTDNRKYSCKICHKKFVSKSYLQTHERIHTGEKMFVCEVCGKGFLTRIDLKIHLTMHTGEKSYVCEMCGKAFARRDALRCHRRSHTGERPYSCEICGQTFTQFTPMAIHKRLHTGERPYSCETCGKGFVSKSTMMSHAKKHHKKTEDRPKLVEPIENT